MRERSVVRTLRHAIDESSVFGRITQIGEWQHDNRQSRRFSGGIGGRQTRHGHGMRFG